MRTSILKVFCLILITQNLSSADLDFHSRCITVQKIPGICLEIRKCKPVIDAIIAGNFDELSKPTICSQQAQTVCCPVESSVSSKASADRVITTTAASVEEKEILKVPNSRIDGIEVDSLKDSTERISERSKT